MPQSTEDNLRSAILDSWDRNNRIMVNLLRALPPGGLDARVMPTSPSVTEMFTHIVYVRLVFVEEDAPEHAGPVPAREWVRDTDPDRIAAALDRSALVVRNVLEDRLRSGVPMQLHYDHPLLFMQHMLWHEGYHHGQMKLALKVAGIPLDDEPIGIQTWGVWIDKTVAS